MSGRAKSFLRWFIPTFASKTPRERWLEAQARQGWTPADLCLVGHARGVAAMRRATGFRTVLVALLVLVAPTAAHAGFVADYFQPSATDASVTLLNPILSPLVAEVMGGSGGGGTTVVTSVIAWLLSHLIVPFGGMLLLYASYLGISHSAMHAELFGNKQQAYWVAVRTVLAFGLVAPAPGLGGLGIINLLLMILTLHGVGAASSLWSVVVDEVTKTPVVLSTTQPPTWLFDALLEGEICAAVYNKLNAVDSAGEPVSAYQLSFQTLANTPTVRVWGWKSAAQGNSHCGHITARNDADMGGILTHIPLADSIGSIQEVQTSGAEVRQAMQRESAGVLTQMQQYASQLAASIVTAKMVQGAKMPEPSLYYQEMMYAQGQIQAAAQRIAASAMPRVTAAFKHAAATEGWATSGFYFAGLATFQQIVNRAVAMDWISTEMTGEITLQEQIDELSQVKAAMFWRDVQVYISAGHAQIAAGAPMGAAVKNPAFGIASGENMSATGKWALDVASNVVRKDVTPLAALATVGAKIYDYGWGLVIGGGVAEGASSLLSFTPWKAAGVVAGKAAEGAFFLGCVLLVAALLSTLICLWPAAIWFKRVWSWWTYAVLAQVGGPAWAILHAHAEGDGLAGAARGGYSMALSLLCRPWLDIAGLLFAYESMLVIGNWAIDVLWPLVMNQGSGTFSLVAVVLFGVVQAGVIVGSLSVIANMEQAVLDYIGGRGTDMDVDGDGDRGRMMTIAAFMGRRGGLPSPPKLPRQKSEGDGGAAGGTAGFGYIKSDGVRTPPSNDDLLPDDKSGGKP